jgi:hypothetical protein
MRIPAIVEGKHAEDAIMLLKIHDKEHCPESWGMAEESPALRWFKYCLRMKRISVVEGMPIKRAPPSERLAREVDPDKPRPWQCAGADFSLNHIKRLGRADGLERLQQLRYLNLSGNQLRTIHGLDALKSLRVLDLSNNQISTMHTGLGGLESLRELDLSMNRIALIEGIEALTSLETMKINCNRVERLLPLTALQSLRNFEARGNQLVEVNQLGLLPRLQRITVSNNRIVNLTQLAKTILLIEDLVELNVAGNPCEADSACRVRLVQHHGIVEIDGVAISDAFRNQLVNLKKRNDLNAVVEATTSEYGARVELERVKKERALRQIREQEQRIEHDFVKYRHTVEREMEECMGYVQQVAASSMAMKESWVATEDGVAQWREKLRREARRRGVDADEYPERAKPPRPDTSNPAHAPPETIAQMRPAVFDAQLAHHMRGVDSLSKVAFKSPAVWSAVRAKDIMLSPNRPGGENFAKGKITYTQSTIGKFVDPDA